MARSTSSFVVALALLAGAAHAFYLPGIAPIDYTEGSQLEVLANKLFSTRNQLPYDYYSVPHCMPDTELKKHGTKVKSHNHLNLGQILSGSRQELTPYDIRMMVEEDCKYLCKRDLDASQVKKVMSKIHDEYFVRLNVDNMPGVERRRHNMTGEWVYFMGYPLGLLEYTDAAMKETPKVFFNNHLRFNVSVHKPKYTAGNMFGAGSFSDQSAGSPSAANQDLYRVVGFEVEVASVDHKGDKNSLSSCPVVIGQGNRLELKNEARSIIFTYDVSFTESNIQWATRWDPLLSASADFKRIQWFTIVNSLLIVLLLAVLVAMILLRTVYLDFARYNNLEDREDIQEDSGWKLCHADVFRPPSALGLLSVFCGTGAQLLAIFAVSLVFAVLGFLSPANRGGLLSAVLFLWVLTSCICGFVAARLYSGMGGQNKKSVTLGSAFFFSGITFSVFFFINMMAIFGGSTESVPFFTLVFLLIMWFGISVPLNVLGAFVGYKMKPYEFPMRTAAIPREIPKYSPINPSIYAVITGILPFGVIFIELLFILNSIWSSELYYMFGFLFVVFGMLLITSVEVSLVLTYLLLCNEDHQWWWRSFLSSASSAFFMFAYSIVYLFTTPDFKGIHFSSALLYLGYMFVLSLGMFCLTGNVGFSAAFLFVNKIFDSVHID